MEEDPAVAKKMTGFRWWKINRQISSLPCLPPSSKRQQQQIEVPEVVVTPLLPRPVLHVSPASVEIPEVENGRLMKDYLRGQRSFTNWMVVCVGEFVVHDLREEKEKKKSDLRGKSYRR